MSETVFFCQRWMKRILGQGACERPQQWMVWCSNTNTVTATVVNVIRPLTSHFPHDLFCCVHWAWLSIRVDLHANAVSQSFCKGSYSRLSLYFLYPFKNWKGGGGGGVQDRSSCFSIELFRCLDLCTFFRTFSNPRLDPVSSDWNGYSVSGSICGG